MQYWTYLPFVQFIRDDKETVTIMSEAMQVIPTVCKILKDHRVQNNSTSSSRLTSTAVSLTSSAPPVRTVSSLTAQQNEQFGRHPFPLEGPSQSTSSEPSTSTLLSSRKRKRQEEAGAILFPLKKRRLMTSDDTDNRNGSRAEGTTEDGLNQTERNDLSRTSQQDGSINPAVENSAELSSGSIEAQLSNVKLKLKQDYNKFVDQVGQLASLERQKNTLIEKFVQLCTAASLPGTGGGNGTGTPTSTMTSAAFVSDSNSVMASGSNMENRAGRNDGTGTDSTSASSSVNGNTNQ